MQARDANVIDLRDVLDSKHLRSAACLARNALIGRACTHHSNATIDTLLTRH